MVTSELENWKKSSDEERLVGAARQFLAALPAQEQIRQQLAEGRAISDIVEGLGLPPAVLAAVHFYPPLRGAWLGRSEVDGSRV